MIQPPHRYPLGGAAMSDQPNLSILLRLSPRFDSLSLPLSVSSGAHSREFPGLPSSQFSGQKSEPDICFNQRSEVMTYRYEVALSFAGEDRSFAEAVAQGLREAGVEVFYDQDFSAELWGEDLGVKLREAYYAQSRFCIMILSPHYVAKMWPNFERQQAIERLIQEKGRGYILPRILAGERIGKKQLATLGHGGLCRDCPECSYPHCPFGKGA